VYSITGWAGGLFLFGSVGALNIYTMILNLDVATRHPQTHSYSEIGKRVLGMKGKITVDIAIWIMQMSMCCSYLYFIADQANYVICHYTGYCGQQKLYIVLLTIPALPISFIETYTFLSYFVMFGMTVAMAGLFSMMGLCSKEIYLNTGCDPSNPDLGLCETKIFNPAEVFGHIGFAMYMFEGNACVVNIRAEAKN